MTRYVALLRGINVSGQRAIRMAALQESCRALGWEEVRTYLQSGNVVFEAPETAPGQLAEALKARIQVDFGHEVEVLVLSGADWTRLASENPLRSRLEGEDKLFHATFLFQPVEPAAFAALSLPARVRDEALLSGQVVLLYLPEGYGDSKLTNPYFERTLKVIATTRNWRTVQALAELCGG